MEKEEFSAVSKLYSTYTMFGTDNICRHVNARHCSSIHMCQTHSNVLLLAKSAELHCCSTKSIPSVAISKFCKYYYHHFVKCQYW